MARKARKKAKKKAKRKAKLKTAKRNTARRGARPRKARTSRSTKKAKRKTAGTSGRAATKSQRRQEEPIPADPAGRIGLARPSNVPFPPGRSEPRELAQADPDARFGDRREPAADAREHPDGSMPPLERRGGYKNTDE